MRDGRDRVPWDQGIWDRIDQAVHAECKRTKIAAKFLPLYGPIDPTATTVPSDRVNSQDFLLGVDETETTPIVEIQVLFELTAQQVSDEPDLKTAVTLARRAANLLSQAEDLLIFQGDQDARKQPLFGGPLKDPGLMRVTVKSGRGGVGLLNLPAQWEKVKPKTEKASYDLIKASPESPGWGEETVRAVHAAYSDLQSGIDRSQAHYGPYVLVLHHVPYADSFAPLKKTLIMPADRMKPIVTDAHGERYFGTGTVKELTALLVSVGGNTLDLVMARDATTAFLQEDAMGNYLFRVFERFAVREKDASCVVRLNFQELATGSSKSATPDATQAH